MRLATARYDFLSDTLKEHPMEWLKVSPDELNGISTSVSRALRRRLGKGKVSFMCDEKSLDRFDIWARHSPKGIG